MSTYRLPDNLGRRAPLQDNSRVLSVDTSALSRVDAAPVARALQYQANATLRAQESVIRSQMSLANSVVDLGQTVQNNAIQRFEDKEKDSLLEAQKNSLEMQGKINEWKYGTPDNPGAYSRKGSDALTIQKDFSEFYGQLKEEYGGKIEGQAATDAFELDSKRILNSSNAEIGRYYQQEQNSYRAELLQGQKEMSLNNIGINFNNDELYEQEIINVVNAEKVLALQEGLQEGTDAFDIRIKKAESQAHRVKINGYIGNNNPTSIIKAKNLANKYLEENRLLYDDWTALNDVLETAYPKAVGMQEYTTLQASGPQNDTQMIDWLIDVQEGGDALAQEPHGNVARFGVNSAFLELYNKKYGTNYTIDGLTREVSHKIYRQEFLAVVDRMDLPPQMRTVAFDTLVNHHRPTAERMIKEANGNPTKLLQLRALEYQRLANADPKEYGGSLNGWMKRLSRLDQRIRGAAPVNGQAVAERAREINLATPGAGDAMLALYQADMKAQEEQKKAQVNGLLDRVLPTVQQNNGQWELLPAEDIALAKELAVFDKIKSYTGATDQEYFLDLKNMGPEELRSFDLSNPLVRLQLSANDYEQIVTLQNKVLNEPDYSNIEKEIHAYGSYLFEKEGLGRFAANEKGEMVVDSSVASGKRRTQDIRETKAKYGAFVADVRADIESYYRVNKRYPNKTETQKIMEDVMSTNLIRGKEDGLFFRGTDNVYGGNITIADLEPEQITAYEAQLRERGMLITREAILNQARKDIRDNRP